MAKKLSFLNGVTLTREERKVYEVMGSNWMEVATFMKLGGPSVTEENLKKLLVVECERADPRGIILDKVHSRIVILQKAREKQEIQDFLKEKLNLA
jgi:hypothetical protein